MRALGLRDPKCAAFDGPPRMAALGFHVANGDTANDDDRKPMIADMFDDPGFRQARHEAMIRHYAQTYGIVRTSSPRT